MNYCSQINNNSYRLVGIKSLKDLCKNLNNPKKLEIKN